MLFPIVNLSISDQKVRWGVLYFILLPRLVISMQIMKTALGTNIKCKHGRHDHVTFSSYRQLQGGIEPKQDVLLVQLGQ
jgi:hypothetical protein